MKVHQTRPVQVWVDADLGIADLVEELNRWPGVRTYASCQGTLGEGGSEPFAPYVMVGWVTAEARQSLEDIFGLDDVSEEGAFGCVRLRAAADVLGECQP